VRGDAEDELAELEGSRAFGLVCPGPAVLETLEESLGHLGPTGQVEGVDARRQFAQRPNWRICD
jgi:hypothetical protein